jgi:hypothetical protein
VDVLTSEREGGGVFLLFAAAATPHHLEASNEEQEDRPCDSHEARRQNADRSEEEVKADKDDERRYCFMMRAFAHHALSLHIFSFHI